MPTQEFINEMKQQLEGDQKRLTAELAGLRAHTELGDEEDENAQEINTDEVNQDLITRIEKDLAMIEKALGKIADGSYGVAEDGREISEARLRAIPWADTAI